jgi:hypothetical protein
MVSHLSTGFIPGSTVVDDVSVSQEHARRHTRRKHAWWLKITTRLEWFRTTVFASCTVRSSAESHSSNEVITPRGTCYPLGSVGDSLSMGSGGESDLPTTRLVGEIPTLGVVAVGIIPLLRGT